MGEINIANSSQRDAIVMTASVGSVRRTRWIDSLGRQAKSVRVLKASLECDLLALQQRYATLDAVGQAILDSDPEIDFERTGQLLGNTSRVYINPSQQVVRKIQFVEIVHHPDGSVRERRPQKLLDTNLVGDAPLKWSGVFIKKADACRKFVFSGKVQLQHVNGLTYDFLYAMAKELESKNSLMLLGAGPKSKEPLILRRGGSPYRGFLEGRTQGELYCLLLHFSNLELRSMQDEVSP